jgi:diaminopimelate epimerase
MIQATYGHGTHNDFVLVFDEDNKLTFTADQIKRVCDRNSGIGSDGLVYSFDPSYYATKVRTIYARVRDSAGNIHGLAISGKTEVDEFLSDKIVQDL